jgi:ribosome-binding factor A
MAVDRIQRINEMIRRELATALYHVGQGEGLDVTAVSFVDVETSRDLRGAVVHVSFLGSAETHPELLKWLRRHRVDFQAHVAHTLQLKYTPKLMFRQTTAVEKGDRVLGILAEIRTPEE